MEFESIVWRTGFDDKLTIKLNVMIMDRQW